jgi:hypothetical protein
MSRDYKDYERIFVGDRQISMTHFFAVNWTEDTERPILFAFGYWSHDAIFHQGLVGWDGERFSQPKAAMKDHRITAVA